MHRPLLVVSGNKLAEKKPNQNSNGGVNHTFRLLYPSQGLLHFIERAISEVQPNLKHISADAVCGRTQESSYSESTSYATSQKTQDRARSQVPCFDQIGLIVQKMVRNW